MESAAVLRSFNCTVSRVRSIHDRPGMIPVNNSACNMSSKLHIQGFSVGGKLVAAPLKRDRTFISCVKPSETTATAKSDVSKEPQGSVVKTIQSATFPSGFEKLMLDVCDETQIAELKLKVGEFEMHLKRNIAVTKAPMPVVSQTTPTPIPSKPIIASAPAVPPPTSSSEKTSPFTNVSEVKSAKLAALEASGASGYVLVSSPNVGSFLRGRTLKGKKQPPICKEGDVIKEGQTIGFLDQFGTELPLKSDVAGEVVKILFDDGEAIGYGDPLLAVLPSFHDIK